jgi:integrase
MAKGTIRDIRAILSGAFEAAMRWEWADRNPARSAKPPTLTRQTMLATSPEDIAKVIAAARARSDALGLYLWLVMVTGIRRGELGGLQIRDVDLDRALVHVAFNYVVRGGRRVRKDTKLSAGAGSLLVPCAQDHAAACGCNRCPRPGRLSHPIPQRLVHKSVHKSGS